MSSHDAVFKSRRRFRVKSMPESLRHKVRHLQENLKDERSTGGLLNKICDPKYPLIGKVSWITILIVCTTLALIKVENRIEHYFSQPVTTKVTIERAQAIEFPRITLCNREPFLKSAIKKLRQEIGERLGKSIASITMNDIIDEYGVEYLWGNASYNVPDMLRECLYSRKSCNKYGEWVAIKTVLGVCYTYQLGRPNRVTGPYHALYIDIKEDSEQTNVTSRGWKVIVHHANEYPGVMVKTKGSTFYPDSRADMVLFMQQFHQTNTREKPCVDDPNYQPTTCFAHCLYQAIAHNVSCQLPYMNLTDVPVCNTSAMYFAATRLQDVSLLSKNTWAERECHSYCPRRCNDFIYGTRTDVRWWPSNVRTIVRVYYEHLMYETVVEQLYYGLVPLLCDIGGILGLFLGVCVLTLFDTLVTVCSSLRYTIKSKFLNWNAN